MSPGLAQGLQRARDPSEDERHLSQEALPAPTLSRYYVFAGSTLGPAGEAHTV